MKNLKIRAWQMSKSTIVQAEKKPLLGKNPTLGERGKEGRGAFIRLEVFIFIIILVFRMLRSS